MQACWIWLVWLLLLVVIMDVPCALATLAYYYGLCRCIGCGVGLDPVLGYGDISSWFEDMVFMMSWIAWLHLSMGAFDSDGFGGDGYVYDDLVVVGIFLA